MNKKKLYLFVGFPGSGKTTVALIIKQLTSAHHIWVDQERKNRFTNPLFTSDENNLLYKDLNQEIIKYLIAGESVIFDTNLNFLNDRKMLSSLAKQNGAKVILIWLTTNIKIAKNRALQASSHDKLRVLGSMDQSTFDKIAAKLEQPTDEENAIKIDGQHIDTNTIKKILNI